MTVQDLQSLITDIDRILAGEGSSCEGAESSYPMAEREILARVRPYLMSLQNQTESAPFLDGEGTETPWQDRVAAAIARSTIDQMNIQRATWMQPWQLELESVRQHRDSLLREIQGLEGQRQQLIADFLQVLLNRVSEGVKHDITQTLEKLETQLLYSAAPDGKPPEFPLKSPSQRLEQLHQLQEQSDRLFLALDSTFRNVFDTLEQDLQGYQESLSKAVKRLYELGLQGEAPPADPPIAPSPEPEVPDEVTPLQPLELRENQSPPSPPVELPDSPGLYPFPGMEIALPDQEIIPPQSDRATGETPSQVDIDAMDDSEIDALLQIEGDGDEEGQRELPPDRSTSAPWEEHLFGSGEEGVAESFSGAEPLGGVSSEISEGSEVGVEQQLFAGLADPAQKGHPSEAVQDSQEGDGPNPAPNENRPLTQVAAAAPPPATATAIPPQQNPAESDQAIDLSDTITSLTELLEQAYTTNDSEGDTYTAVPPGESLVAVEEAELSSEAPGAAIDNPQIEEQLEADLERFQGEVTPQEAPETEDSLSPPAELLGENLETVVLDELSVEDDLWADTPAAESRPSQEEENLSIPTEIATEPWSAPSQDRPLEPDEWEDSSQPPEH